MIRHFVFLRYSKGVTQASREALLDALRLLKSEVDGYLSLHAAKNISPEAEFVHGMTDLFWIDFRDEAARDAYLANETHKAIGRRIMESLDSGAQSIFVCDIEC